VEAPQAARVGAADGPATTHCAERAVVGGLLSDQLVDGTRLRAFNVMDDFTRECLAIEVDTSIPGLRATRVLTRHPTKRGSNRLPATR